MVFLVVALNVVGNVARQQCNFVLRGITILLGMTIKDPEEKEFLNNIPKDARAARKAFDLDPCIITYACCPVCSYPHELTDNDGQKRYPARCTFRRYKTSQPCGARLTKNQVKDGESICVPIRPFALQSFQVFVGAMYSREGIEETVRRTNVCLADDDDLWDIKEGSSIQGLTGPDGKPFLHSTDELRTVWSLSYDGFNPYHNKAAGKSASVGSLGMACLSLPPSLRYLAENLFLAGLVPGRKQPTLDELDPILLLLVKPLLNSYNTGTWYSRTYEHPEGRRSREAVAVTVCDLPGSRKLTGCAGHSANKFCSLCHLHKDDINNIDQSTPGWQRCTYDEHKKAAEAWLAAPNKTQRKRLWKINGVRWSPLLLLPYWDPTEHVVVDAMHNLFLGLVRHHFREVIGTHWKEQKENDDEDMPAVSAQALEKGRKIMSKSPTRTKLHSLTISVLRALCLERNLGHLVKQQGSRTKKWPFIDVLLVRYQT